MESDLPRTRTRCQHGAGSLDELTAVEAVRIHRVRAKVRDQDQAAAGHRADHVRVRAVLPPGDRTAAGPLDKAAERTDRAVGTEPVHAHAATAFARGAVVGADQVTVSNREVTGASAG